MNRKEILLLLTLGMVQFTHIVDFMIVMPLAPQLMRIFQIQTSDFSLVVASYTFSAGLSGFVAAFFIDMFRRRAMLFWLYIGFALGTLACGLAPDFNFLLIARIITGLFGGVINGLALAIVADAFAIERRGTAMGSLMASFSVASVVGVPFSLWIAGLYGWHAPFFVLAGASLPVCVCIYLFVPHGIIDQNARKARPFAFLKTIFSDLNQVAALGLTAILVFSQFLIIPYLATYMVFNVGFKENQLMLIYLFGGAFSVITSPLIGRWADKKGRRYVFTFFGLLCIIPIFVITHLPSVSLIIALIITTLFFIFSGGRMVPAQTIVSGAAPISVRGSFMSLNSCVQQFGAAAASFVGGHIIFRQSTSSAVENYGTVGIMSCIFAILAIWIGRYIRIIDPKPKPVILPAVLQPENLI